MSIPFEQEYQSRRTALEVHDSKGILDDLLPLGEFAQYRCAVAVAEASHFTRAARHLHMDQSAVSRHIQRLESRLGIKIFARNARGADVTDAGSSFIQYARRALVTARAGEQLAQTIAAGEPPVLEIAYSSVVDTGLIAKIDSLGSDVRCRVPLRFLSVSPEKLAERLTGRMSQAAIGVLPTCGEIATACILRENLHVALPSRHRLAGFHTIRIGQLASDPVIWPFGPRDGTLTQHFLELFRRAGYLANIARESQSFSEALGLVREGFGIAFVKSSELRLHPEGVVIRPFAEPYLVVETGLLYIEEHRWKVLAEFVSLVTASLHCDSDEPSS